MRTWLSAAHVVNRRCKSADSRRDVGPSRPCCYSAHAAAMMTADARVTFTSPVYGYSIAHPGSWDSVNARRTLTDGEQPATSSGATDILGTDASMRVSAMTLPGVIIAAQPVRNDVTIEEWTASMVDTVAFMKRCDRPDRRERVEIGGEPGILLTYATVRPTSAFFTSGRVSYTKDSDTTSFGSTIVVMKTPIAPSSNTCSPRCPSTKAAAAP